MNIDLHTVACTFGIPFWWLEKNFDTNTVSPFPHYMSQLSKEWKKRSALMHKLHWYVPNYADIKERMFQVGFETRPCYDCKTDLKFNEAAYARIFAKEQTDNHFNLFLLCKVCACKTRPITIKSVKGAIIRQSSVSTKQKLLKAEIKTEETQLRKLEQQLEQIKTKKKEIELELSLVEPLTTKLKELQDENNSKRKELIEFKKERELIKTEFVNSAQIGTSILDAMRLFEKTLVDTNKKLVETVDEYADEFSDEKTCGICWQKIENYSVIMPCNHVYCTHCTNKIRKCPMCNVKIIGTHKILFP